MARNGQSEIMGLLVIVVILVFFGLIYLGFTNIAESGSLSSERTNLEAENSLKAIMKVNLEGYGGTMEDLIVGCGQHPSGCGSLESAVGEILGVILRPGTEFSFSANEEDTEIFFIGVCQIGVVSSYVFVYSGVFYEAKLKLCGDD